MLFHQFPIFIEFCFPVDIFKKKKKSFTFSLLGVFPNISALSFVVYAFLLSRTHLCTRAIHSSQDGVFGQMKNFFYQCGLLPTLFSWALEVSGVNHQQHRVKVTPTDDFPETQSWSWRKTGGARSWDRGTVGLRFGATLFSGQSLCPSIC